jgi:hypothetical protein
MFRKALISAVGLFCLGCASGALGAPVPTIVCDGDTHQGVPTAGNPDLFAFDVICGNGSVRFTGTAEPVSNGTLSDLVVRGSWTKLTPLGSDAMVQSSYFADFDSPPGPKVRAWHVLSGSVRFAGSSHSGTASISVSGGLQGQKGPHDTGGTRSGDLHSNGGFKAVSEYVPVEDDPNWTRSANYTISFGADTEAGSRLSMGATGHNAFAVPLPSSAAMAVSSLLPLSAAFFTFRRRCAET